MEPMSAPAAPSAPCPPGGVRWEDGHCVPQGLLDAQYVWLLDIVVPVLSAIMLIIIARDCIRRRLLSWWMLVAIASASCWWLETFGDWGQHLAYSPLFAHYVIEWPYAGRHNPYWMPLTYAIYWAAHTWIILRLAQWLMRKRPGLTLGWSIILLSMPVTWIWNLIVEGTAAQLGWWTYDPGIGPVVELARGNWPLLWPVALMFGWINLIAWMVGPPEEEVQLNRLERFMGLHRLLQRPHWRQAGTAAGTSNPSAGNAGFQLVRLLAWIVYFQVTFLLTLNLPLLLLRVITGWDSPYLP